MILSKEDFHFRNALNYVHSSQRKLNIVLSKVFDMALLQTATFGMLAVGSTHLVPRYPTSYVRLTVFAKFLHWFCNQDFASAILLLRFVLHLERKLLIGRHTIRTSGGEVFGSAGFKGER